MNNIIVWHRRDLRTVDNLALYKASLIGNPIPVYVFDPVIFSESSLTNSDRHLFMLESLEALDLEYRKLGTKLIYLFGDPITVLESFRKRLNATVYFNHDTNTLRGFLRDVDAQRLGYLGYSNDAILRNSYNSEEWQPLANGYFHSVLHKTPFKFIPVNYKSKISPNKVKIMYNLKSKKNRFEKGGYVNAKLRMVEFGKHIHKYPGSLSKPNLAKNYCSRLSTHYSFGTISLREVFQYVGSLSVSEKVKSFYVSRLFWHQIFTQKMQDFWSLETLPLNAYFENKYDEMYQEDEIKISAWREGRTGYPLVDACMRCLVKTGWLNFRMRAMVASFFVFTLRQPWKIGADFFHYHLIDADTAINYAQWQMQAGFIGTHPNRMYNPTKQLIDNDPDCVFVKAYVPELQQFSNEYILQNPLRRQMTLFGESYISPIVDFEIESKKARDLYTRLNAEAKRFQD